MWLRNSVVKAFIWFRVPGAEISTRFRPWHARANSPTADPSVDPTPADVSNARFTGQVDGGHSKINPTLRQLHLRQSVSVLGFCAMLHVN